MPTSAAISRKLKPPKPPSCMRRSAASMIAVLTSLMGSLHNYLLIDSSCAGEKTTAINLPIDKISREHGAELAISWRYGGNPAVLAAGIATIRSEGDVLSDLRSQSQAGEVRSLSRPCERLKLILEGIDG